MAALLGNRKANKHVGFLELHRKVYIWGSCKIMADPVLWNTDEHY